MNTYGRLMTIDPVTRYMGLDLTLEKTLYRIQKIWRCSVES
jgi:hypothetical protein